MVELVGIEGLQGDADVSTLREQRMMEWSWTSET
jgi:hypothetical protein